MSESLPLAQAREWLDRLERLAPRKECRSCDCLQGLLTQLELDYPELSEPIRPMKVANQEMHGCLGCDPCPPGALFAEYLRRQNGLAGGEYGARDREKGETRGIVQEQYGKIAKQDGSCCGPKSSCCGTSDPGAGCCGDKAREDARDNVRKHYARTARSEGSCCSDTSCCTDTSNADEVARKLGYNENDLSMLPDGANMGLSCGNPTALASLEPGEVVVDLGSGGGLDVFVAARRVGHEGRAIGVDMTPEMISKARRNAEHLREKEGLDNVEFRLGEIEHLPLPDCAADVVISNCVINLSPDKEQVWREIARVLRPGGRVAVSDVALLQRLPESIQNLEDAYCDCLSGAIPTTETERMAREAGLEKIEVRTAPAASEKESEWVDDAFSGFAKLLPDGQSPGDYVTNMYVQAVKPGGK